MLEYLSFCQADSQLFVDQQRHFEIQVHWALSSKMLHAGCQLLIPHVSSPPAFAPFFSVRLSQPILSIPSSDVTLSLSSVSLMVAFLFKPVRLLPTGCSLVAWTHKSFQDCLRKEELQELSFSTNHHRFICSYLLICCSPLQGTWSTNRADHCPVYQCPSFAWAGCPGLWEAGDLSMGKARHLFNTLNSRDEIRMPPNYTSIPGEQKAFP